MLPEVEPQSYEVTVTGRYIFDRFLPPHRTADLKEIFVQIRICFNVYPDPVFLSKC
jgi:hypothetical protein